MVRTLLSAGKQRRELAGREFMKVEKGDAPDPIVPERMQIGVADLPKRLSEHEIQIDFKVSSLPCVA